MNTWRRRRAARCAVGRRSSAQWPTTSFVVLLAAVAAYVAAWNDAVHGVTGQSTRQDRTAAQRERLALVRAGAVRHLPGHTEWPEGSFEDQPDRKAPLIILMIGLDGSGFEPYLDELLHDHRVHDRRVIARRFRWPTPPPGADEPREEDVEVLRRQALESHVLYIGRSEAQTGRLEQILNWVEGRSILTLSAIDNFAEKGGMIGFSSRHNRLAMDANPEAIRKADLRVSTRVLRLARIITPPDGQSANGNGD